MKWNSIFWCKEEKIFYFVGVYEDCTGDYSGGCATVKSYSDNDFDTFSDAKCAAEDWGIDEKTITIPKFIGDLISGFNNKTQSRYIDKFFKKIGIKDETQY